MYIQHGSQDNIVPVSEAYAIRDALEELSKPHKFKIFNGGGHNFELEARFKDEEFEETLKWLDKYLK